MLSISEPINTGAVIFPLPEILHCIRYNSLTCEQSSIIHGISLLMSNDPKWIVIVLVTFELQLLKAFWKSESECPPISSSKCFISQTLTTSKSFLNDDFDAFVARIYTESIGHNLA